MTSQVVLKQIARSGFVPVLTIDDASHATDLAAALLDGGATVVEVTLRTPASVEALTAISSDTRLTVGAGTVLTREHIDDALAAGARFIVSPGFNPDLADHCRELGVPFLPGVATASEIIRAAGAGAECVKFFPAEPLGGINAISALAAVFPDLRFVPTGGISAENMCRYLRQPSVAAVAGSWCASPELLSRQEWPEVTRRAAEALQIVDRARRTDGGISSGR